MFLVLFIFMLHTHCVWGEIHYTATLQLEPHNAALHKQLEEQSYLKSLSEHLPDTFEELCWRAERDKIQLERFLCSKGYMRASITHEVRPGTPEKEPASVVLTIQSNSIFTYKSIHVESQDAPSWFKEEMIETQSIRVGAEVNYENIQRTQEKLEKEAKNKGHPWAVCGKPTLDTHTDTSTADLVFPMTFGPHSLIGRTTLEGLQHIDATYVRNRLRWHEGQDFDQRLIEETKETLIATSLFSEVDIQIQKRPGNENITDITVKLVEAPARAIGAGLRYATSEGIGGRIFWRHKNVWGKGHSLELGSRRTKFQTRTETKWDVPDFWQPQQTLSNVAFTSIERQRAYRGRIYGGNIMLGRPLGSKWTGKAGVLIDRSRLRQDQTPYESRLLGAPVQLNFDGSNNLLDPTQGIRLSGWGTPFWGTLNNKRSTFINTRLHVSGYMPLSSSYRGGDPVVVLAGFGRLGKILGRSLTSIPPHQRFYAGGADSIRAYGPQMLGPLDSNRIPLGGLFLTEYGGEIRLKTSETIGVVAFAEAGTLTSHGVTGTLDHFKAKSLWGTGLGLRYYTPLGPIRADVAFPLTRRRDTNRRTIDAPYQFYISFGQAF